MPYLGTVSIRALHMTLLYSVLIGSAACGDDEDKSERDGSVNDGENGGGDTSGTNDGTNGSGGANNSGGTSDNNTNGGGTAGTNGGSTAGTNGGGTAGGTNGSICGGFAGATCPDGYFCNQEQEAGGAGCDTADGAGVCQEIPTGCPTIYDPVCSCDLRTYANACTAHGKSASVLHTGACTIAECEMVGGRTVTSNGASTPECKSGETGFELAGGREPTICCIKE